ncbi:MAG: LysM peptidoglycan-binding domain-containing protein [Chloroflexota bacterium]
MKSWKRLLFYLMLNVVVSACTMLVVLFLWNRTHPAQVVSTPLPLTTTLSLSDTSTPIPPTPEPTESLIVYQVNSGDTLGSIALEFGVSVEELMTLNGLTDPHTLSAGQVLFVPVHEEGTASAEVHPTTEYPLVPQPLEVEIVAVVGVGDLDMERVLIKRVAGAGELSLENWRLQDENGNVYIFPRLILYKDGAVTVYSKSGVDTVVELYWGRDEPVWQSGELVTLSDGQMNLQAAFLAP